MNKGLLDTPAMDVPATSTELSPGAHTPGRPESCTGGKRLKVPRVRNCDSGQYTSSRAGLGGLESPPPLTLQDKAMGKHWLSVSRFPHRDTVDNHPTHGTGWL